MAMPLATVIFIVLQCVAINSMNECTRNGDIRIVGMSSTCILAGRIDLCHNYEWTAVCHANWDKYDAQVVCRQFGYPARGALSCNNSCYGRNELRGLYGFQCSGHENNLTECRSTAIRRCGWAAGVTCLVSNCLFEPLTTISTMEERPRISYPTALPSMTPSQHEDTTEVRDKAEVNTACHANAGQNSTAVLGVVSAGFLLGLVAVVIGWMYTCHRNQNKTTQLQQDSWLRHEDVCGHAPKTILPLGLTQNDNKECKEGVSSHEIKEGRDVHHALEEAETAVTGHTYEVVDATNANFHQ